MQPQEFVQIGIGNAPALADIDGAQMAKFDPVAHGRLGHLQAVSDVLDGLILIQRHGLLLLVGFCED